MSSARVASGKGFAIPVKPIYIDFLRSDGSEDRWPMDNAVAKVDANGEVNYYYPVMDTSEPIYVKWIVEVGKKVAELMGKPGTYNCLVASNTSSS